MPAPHSTSTRRPLPRGPLIVGALLVVLALIVVFAVGRLTLAAADAASAAAPAVGTRILASSTSTAARASVSGGGARETAAADWLARQPTTVWLTPEGDPIDAVHDRVVRLADEARGQDAALSVAVYGLPDRDCGSHSTGGLDPEDYAEWTSRIGRALASAAGLQKIVILEPDSVALSPSCGSLTERAGYLRTAVDNLSGPGTWIYIDAGNSAWHPAEEMAELLRATGLLSSVRGVALNVSNYQDTASEFAYAHELSDLLGGTHAVIDTSRNGAGPAGAQWCNPAGRRVGSEGGSYGDGVVDTNLWIKPPRRKRRRVQRWPRGRCVVAGCRHRVDERARLTRTPGGLRREMCQDCARRYATPRLGGECGRESANAEEWVR
ncbi:glycoside hydrolase family 6 protein [Microbacterium proteolyticum]|uniref:glycoside hydrolase family 6 protein n=1 Tax=Microbacterium proteolyticum TaxID=1572644 RepID=UPI0027D7704B|nr:glycoside hydrolase family 6 protein [Microbacterium proteolyticum]